MRSRFMPPASPWHNVMATLDRMRAAFADPARRSALDGVGGNCHARGTCIGPSPDRKRIADVPGGTLQPGTLVTFQLAVAAERALDRRVAFQSESWSACPASTFVFGLLALVCDAGPRRGGASMSEDPIFPHSSSGN